MRQYILDSNFFIEAHRVYYPLDVVPSFWLKLKMLAEEHVVISLDKVKNEIYPNKDDLSAWCQENLSNDFFKSSDEVMVQYAQLVRWTSSRSDYYKTSAIDEFLQAEEADAFIISYALADPSNRIIVTQEKADNSKKKIKIPDVCREFDLKYINTIQLLRELKISL